MTHHRTFFGSANAQLQPWKDVRAEVLDHRANAIMPAVTAFFAQSQTPEIERDVIIDDQNLLWFPLMKAHYFCDTATAKIHERERFHRFHSQRGQRSESAFPARIGLKRLAESRDPAVEHHKADIVSGPFILSTRVTESNDEPNLTHSFVSGSDSSSSHSISFCQRREMSGRTNP